MSIYEDNLTALRSAFPGFTGEMECSYGVSEEMEIIPTPSGHPTARLDGKYLHSARDPQREARRAVSSQELRRSRICVFLGFGLGYHVEAYLGEGEEDRIAIVVEKEPALFLQALSHRDLTALFYSGRVTLLLDTPPRDVIPLLGSSGGSRIALLDVAGRSGRSGEYYAKVRETVINHRSRGEVNLSTLNRFGRLWVRNLARNIPLLPEAEDAGKLQHLFEGMPVLVVAAGPSLDDLFPLLPLLAERMPVVAVDTALQALRSCGVEPDMLTVVDPQYWNTRHLDRQQLSSTLLISESSTHPAVFRRPIGRLFFGGSVFPLGEFLETESARRFKLGAGGSVATTAWDLARILGASAVYMAGLDLGFPDARTHYTGSYFEERLHQTADRLHPHETALFAYLRGGAPFHAPNNSGGETLTDKRLVVYTKWFEEQLLLSAAPPTYNLSPGGVAIDGMQPAEAQDLLREPVRRPEIRRRLTSLPQDNRELRSLRRRELAERVEQLVTELEELGSTARRAEQLTRRLRELTNAPEQTACEGEREGLVAELETIDRQLIASGGKEVAGFLLQGFIDAMPDSGEVSTGEWLRISYRLYRELAEAAEYHLRLFRTAAP
jgi:hypothetical protein